VRGRVGKRRRKAPGPSQKNRDDYRKRKPHWRGRGKGRWLRRKRSSRGGEKDGKRLGSGSRKLKGKLVVKTRKGRREFGTQGELDYGARKGRRKGILHKEEKKEAPFPDSAAQGRVKSKIRGITEKESGITWPLTRSGGEKVSFRQGGESGEKKKERVQF